MRFRRSVATLAFLSVPLTTLGQDTPSTLYFDNGAVYVGDTQDGIANGQGLLSWCCDEGASLEAEGLFSDGMLVEGTITNGDSVQKGVFIDGLLDGNGSYEDSTLLYVGGFKYGDFHGVGQLTFKEGYDFGSILSYDGEFRYGSPDGDGEFKYQYGSYAGEVRGYVPDGNGKYTFNDGMIEEGSFNNGLLQMGTRNIPGVGEYRGQFIDGIVNGYGTFTNLDGNEWSGEWKEAKAHGTMLRKITSDASQEIDWYLQGEFNDDVPIGTHIGSCGAENPCRVLYEDGEVAEVWDIERARQEAEYRARAEARAEAIALIEERARTQARAEARRYRERIERIEEENRRRAVSNILLTIGAGLISGSPSGNSFARFKTCYYSVAGEIVPFPQSNVSICPITRSFGGITGILQ